MDYLEGSFGHEAHGKRLRILDAYVEARQAAASGLLTGEEAMSTSDFPTYIGKFFRHTFLGRYTEISGAWQQYTHDFSAEDFESYTSSRFGRFPDIPEKPLNGPYEELAVRELPGPSLKLKEYGAGFSLTRQLIISDRLGKIRELPTLFAEALGRTVSKAAVAVIETNAAMWDGVVLFHASHANTGTTALTADVAGADAIKAALDALYNQTDPEGYKVVNPGAPYYLIIPYALHWIAEALRDRETLPLDIASGTSVLRANEVKGKFEIIDEPYLTDTNNWYMTVDPKGTNGFLTSVTLNGNNTPFLGVKDPGVRAVLGGDDPYSFDFDEVSYKIRHDWNFVPTEYRTIYGSIVS